MINKIKNSGFALISISMFLFSCCNALQKFLTKSYSPSNIIFIRSCFGLFIVLGFVVTKRISNVKENLFLNITRNILSATALIFTVYSLKYLPLSVYEFTVFLSPMIISTLAIIFLKEKGSYFILVSLILGFFGATIMFYPFQEATLNLGLIFSLLYCVFYSLSVVITKKIAHLNYPLLYSIYIITCFLLNGILSYKNFSLNIKDLPIFFASALIHFLAFYLYVLALRKEDLVKLSPLEYTTVIWSILFGYIIWNYIPHLKEILGGIFIIIGSYFVMMLPSFKKKLKKFSLLLLKDIHD